MFSSPDCQQNTRMAGASLHKSLHAPNWAMQKGGRHGSDLPPNSRATRRPEIDVSGMAARHSRVTSSTTFRMRNRRPQASWSWTKSSDQRALGRASTRIGARVPTALRRARRLRTASLRSAHTGQHRIAGPLQHPASHSAPLRRCPVPSRQGGRECAPRRSVSLAASSWAFRSRPLSTPLIQSERNCHPNEMCERLCTLSRTSFLQSSSMTESRGHGDPGARDCRVTPGRSGWPGNR